MFDRVRMLVGRNSILVGNTFGTAILKGGSVALSFFSMPAYLRFFDDGVTLGVWFTILSVLNWMLLLDFGVGNGLRNSLAGAMAFYDMKLAKQLISSAYAFALFVAVALGSIGWVAIGAVDWTSLLGVSGSKLARTDLEVAMRIVLLGVSMQIVLRNVVSILYALQRLVVANSLSFIASFAVLVFLYVGKSGDPVSDLWHLSFFHVTATAIPLLVASGYVFLGTFSDSRPDLRALSRFAFRKVVGLGLGFFVIQVSLLVVGATDQVLIANRFGSEQVIEYQVYFRVFGLFGIMFQLLAQPVWSAVSANLANGRFPWVQRVHRFLLLLAGACSLVAVLMTIVLQKVFDLWLGAESLEVDARRALVFAGLASVEMFVYASTSVANGLGRLRVQLVLVAFGALVKFPLFFCLAALLDSWVAAVGAHFLCLLPLAFVQPLVLRRVLRER